jgi:hypothetical protein
LASRINLQAGGLAVLPRTWYRRLARLDLLMVEARQRIAIQEALISNLECEERTLAVFSRGYVGPR